MKIFGSKKREAELQDEVTKLREEVEELRKLKDAVPDDFKSAIELSKKAAEIVSDSNRRIEQAQRNCETEKSRFQEMKALYNKEIEHTKEQLNALNEQLQIAQDSLDYIDIGVYAPAYEFESAEEYKSKLEEFKKQEKYMVKNETYASWNQRWVINGDIKRGQKLAKDFKKLLLRAFNTECDELIRRVNTSNFETYKKRMERSCEAISKLGAIVDIHITSGYLDLKKSELQLALDFAQYKQDEKERIREIKAQQREEAKVQKEIEEARKKLEKERAHYQNAMKILLAQLKNDPDNQDLLAKQAELEANIADTQKAIEDVDYREANKRAGYVYIISNIGAFGENIYKIGMTRRLEPMERVYELGDASVPFPFDVHALIFSEDAPALETALHNAFESKKLNKINHRREFFNVTLDEIKKVVRENFDKTVEWVDVPVAEQFRQSVAKSK